MSKSKNPLIPPYFRGAHGTLPTLPKLASKAEFVFNVWTILNAFKRLVKGEPDPEDVRAQQEADADALELKAFEEQERKAGRWPNQK